MFRLGPGSDEESGSRGCVHAGVGRETRVTTDGPGPEREVSNGNNRGVGTVSPGLARDSSDLVRSADVGGSRNPFHTRPGKGKP